MRRARAQRPYELIEDWTTRSRLGRSATRMRTWRRAFKGLSTHADTDLRCTTAGSPCEGSQEAVHPVILVEALQETPVDGPVEGGRAFPWSISAPDNRQGVRLSKFYQQGRPVLARTTA